MTSGNLTNGSVQPQEKKVNPLMSGHLKEAGQQTYPPKSALLSVAVVPADAGSAGDVFLTQSDTSAHRQTHTHTYRLMGWKYCVNIVTYVVRRCCVII